MLEGWLDFHRATLRVKCAGLTDEQLRLRSVEPSTLSLLGLIRHMTEVELGWFVRGVGGEEVTPMYYSDDNLDGDFDDVDDADAAADLAAYEAAVERARGAAAGASLDEVFERTRSTGVVRYQVRWVYLHMIEEYARHNGHADLLRQRIDGATGD